MSHWLNEFNLSSKQARSLNGKDLGNLRDVGNNYVLAEGQSKYYIPTYLIEKYHRGTLWFKIDEDEAKSKFMIASEPARM